ncbi:hypothetical protein NKH56_28865 [Mesorhizobium sp. M1076]|uniref:hypothetical protein n=1 Tax=Mesorhizobium sp. M1076 TaxID=2957054 RepID=UPI0033356557
MELEVVRAAALGNSKGYRNRDRGRKSGIEAETHGKSSTEKARKESRNKNRPKEKRGVRCIAHEASAIAHGGRVVTFSRSLVAEIASAAVAALMEPTPNDRTHTEAETFLDLINNGDAERLASFHYGNMARTGGSIMVAPEDVAWDHYTFKRELLQPRSDNEPADISEALRWCVVVDNIPECDADTAGIIYIERERETPLMRKFLGRLSAMSSNQVILKRDLGGLSL